MQSVQQNPPPDFSNHLEQAVSTGPSLQSTASRKRMLILLLLFVTVVINFLDRSNLSLVAPALMHDIGISPAQIGWIFSAFGWTYAAMQIPGGWLVDRMRPRLLYALALALWSLATISLGFVGGFVGLFALRLVIGALEAPAYPINSRVVTTWFPERERASAVGIYTSGQFVGLAFLTPLLAWIQHQYGWQMVFIGTGLIGIMWAILWYAVYREPRQFKGVNQAEIELIMAGGGLVDLEKMNHAGKDGFSFTNLKFILSKRKLWGIYLGQFAVGSTLWFFLTWFPTYLVKYRHMDFIRSGLVASIPFLAAFLGVVSAGLFSDWLIRKGASVGFARKLPIVSGLLISTCIIGANFTDSTNWVIFFMALAFFGNGFASITWSLVTSLAPERMLGLTGGTFNFVGNLSAISAPLVIGYLVSDSNFAPALIYVSCTALLGALSYIFLVGKVERITA